MSDDVCRNQSAFNQALENASREKEEAYKWYNAVIGLLWLIMVVICFVVIGKLPLQGTEKIQHYFFAMLAPPMYLLAYILGGASNK